MDLKIQNKVYIISGGAQGIGRAITLELAQEGAIPVIVDRSQKEAEELKDLIIKNGGKCLVINVILGEGDICKDIIAQTVEAFGRIDGVVNNAGINDGVGLLKGNPGAFKVSVNTNLTHYYDLVHYAIPYLIESKGAIVIISSKIALTGQGGTSGYAASKGAQLALTREWAVELAPHGVRVNAILPAEVMTPQYQQWIDSFDDKERSLEVITSRIPLGKRMTQSEEIAATAVFLLSEKSAHTTGQWLFVDGGYIHLDRSMT